MQEGRNIEHKLSLDPSSEKDKVELVKLIVAFANSGGGEIVFGKNHEKTIGVNTAIVDALDSAKCADLVAKYCNSQVHLSHQVEPMPNGMFLFVLKVPASSDLIVMSREGTWSGFDPHKDKALFVKGDIWVRHSSKTERISNQDIREWTERLRSDERGRILSVISTLSSMPDGSKVEIVSASGKTIETPEDLLTNACFRRRRDQAHLLTAGDLLWIFLNRQTISFNLEELGILIASALRRNATLYWWISQVEDDSRMLLKELQGAISGSDRDKSDAARSVIELGAIYADENNIREILSALRRSRYSHFRKASEQWSTRKEMKLELLKRINNAKLDRKPLIDLDINELERIATSKAKELYPSKPTAASSTLGTINRLIWYKRKGHLIN
jgi:hypothetical protein